MPSRSHVYRITDAHVGLSEDQQARTRRYLISMAVRTVCFLGAVVADGWLRWTLVAGAVLLPYIAVVIANGGRERNHDGDDVRSVYVQPQSQPELPSWHPESRN
ncbi:MAG: hypothetical protein RLZ55_1646 [Actinomycetota bacterium]